MTFTINNEYSESTTQAPRNSTKICPKLTKSSKRHDNHCCGIPVANWDKFHTNCNTSSIQLEQKFMCRVDVQLFFKNVRRNKKKGLY